jgi:hypothetical protein
MPIDHSILISSTRQKVDTMDHILFRPSPSPHVSMDPASGMRRLCCGLSTRDPIERAAASQGRLGGSDAKALGELAANGCIWA